MSVIIVFQKQKQVFDELMIKRYDSYLESEEWQEKRERRKEEVNGCCEVCDRSVNNKGVLDHKTYENLFEENEEDYQYICWGCNDEKHGE